MPGPAGGEMRGASSPLTANSASEAPGLGAEGTIAQLMRRHPLLRDASTGACVGFTDIAFVYPLAVLATRRECGIPLSEAIAQRRFWAGGWTAGTLLVPYSIAVESLSRLMQRLLSGGSGEKTVLGDMAAAAATTVVVTVGLQPIEKKGYTATVAGTLVPLSFLLSVLVLDQMLQEGGQTKGGQARPGVLGPLREILSYQKRHGTRALYDGTVPLMLRELCYITAITVVNPIVNKAIRERAEGGGGSGSGLAGVLGSFLVGASAGMASAPFQTVSAMMKSEEYTGRGFAPVRAEIFKGGGLHGIHRLWFGAATRSARTGGACILYSQYRAFMESVTGEQH